MNQLASIIGFVRASNKLTSTVKKIVYTSMIVPHFQYCSTILFLCIELDYDLNDVQEQQNQMMMCLVFQCLRDTTNGRNVVFPIFSVKPKQNNKCKF